MSYNFNVFLIYHLLSNVLETDEKPDTVKTSINRLITKIKQKIVLVMERAEAHIQKSENTNRISVAAAAPAFLLCTVPLMILVLDVIMPSMSVLQYKIYPLAIRIVALISIICMGACLSSEIDRDTVKVDFKDICFILFVVCMVISTIINGISHDAIFSVPYRYVGVFDLFIYIFIYMYCSGRIGFEKLKAVFIISLMTVSDLIAAVFLYDYFTGKIAAFSDKLEPAAIFFHGNHYGYFLVTVIAVSAGCYCFGKGKLAAFGTFSLIEGLAALALNRSMGCLLAAAGSLVLMILMSVIGGGSQRKKSLMMLLLIAAVSFAALFISSRLRADVAQTIEEFIQIVSGDNNIYAGNGRWGIWQYVAGYISDYPMWGYGCEGIAEIMKDYTLTTNPHNEPLTYAVFFGIPAAVFYCAGVLTAVIKGIRSKAGSSFSRIAAFGALAYFISSCFGVAMFYTAPYLFLLLGMASDEACLK